MLCGLLCSAQRGDVRDRWLKQALDPEHAKHAECRDMLGDLHTQTAQALTGDGFDFAPLLPNEDAPLDLRVAALESWCQGFMYGLGLGEIGELDRLPPDAREVVDDLAEIARSRIAVDAESEENEQAYMEVVEYLRVGIQLVHEELHPATPGQFPAPPNLH